MMMTKKKEKRRFIARPTFYNADDSCISISNLLFPHHLTLHLLTTRKDLQHIFEILGKLLRDFYSLIRGFLGSWNALFKIVTASTCSTFSPSLNVYTIANQYDLHFQSTTLTYTKSTFSQQYWIGWRLRSY